MAINEKDINILAQLTQHQYILTQILQQKASLYYDLSETNPKPRPPVSPPKADIKNYPVYDERQYLEQTKSEWGEYATNAGVLLVLSLGLLVSVIGIILIPVTLTASIFMYIMIPTRKRKVARKAYIKECEEIDKSNQKAFDDVAQYQKDYAKYEQRLFQYEQQQKYQNHQKELLNQQLILAEQTLKSISECLNSYYEKSNGLKKYSSYIAIHTINSYLQSNRCVSVINAITLFEEEKRNGRIAPSIQYTKENLSVSREFMPHVMNQLNEADYMQKQLIDDILRYASDYDQTNMHSLAKQSRLELYCKRALADKSLLTNS